MTDATMSDTGGRRICYHLEGCLYHTWCTAEVVVSLVPLVVALGTVPDVVVFSKYRYHNFLGTFRIEPPIESIKCY